MWSDAGREDGLWSDAEWATDILKRSRRPLLSSFFSFPLSLPHATTCLYPPSNRSISLQPFSSCPCPASAAAAHRSSLCPASAAAPTSRRTPFAPPLLTWRRIPMHPQTRVPMRLRTRTRLRSLPTAVVGEEIGEELGEQLELAAKASDEINRNVLPGSLRY